VREYTDHYHLERNHQGLGNQLIDRSCRGPRQLSRIERRARLGGLLNFYDRETANGVLAHYGIVHDIGNLLAVMRLQAQFVRLRAERLDGGRLVVESAERLLSATQHLQDLVRGVLDPGRAQRLELAVVRSLKQTGGPDERHAFSA
jgi:hypothetical protein